MKPFKKLLIPMTLSFFAAVLFTSCSDNEPTSRLVITMIDSPGDYVAVNIDIAAIRVHSNEKAGETDAGWVTLQGGDMGIKNILDYTSGTELTLADTDFPSGKISQIRLVLNQNNTLDIEQEDESIITENLTIPSGGTAGLKLNVNETLREGITYKFTLDFDVNKSVVKTMSGIYNLKPVIKVITEATSGALEGTVTPVEESVAVYVINDSDTVASSFAIADVAEYLVAGIPAGNYIVSFDPGENSLYAEKSIEEVEITVGEVTELNPVILELK